MSIAIPESVLIIEIASAHFLNTSSNGSNITHIRRELSDHGSFVLDFTSRSTLPAISGSDPKLHPPLQGSAGNVDFDGRDPNFPVEDARKIR